LQKIFNAVFPVSRKDYITLAERFVKTMESTTLVLEGLQVASSQQASMLTSMAEQVAGLQIVKAEEQGKKDKGTVEDVSFQ